MRLKYRAEFYDGETKEILVSPMAMIGWEKHTGKTMGSFGENLSMEGMVWLAWEQARLQGFTTDDFDTWAATLADIDVVQDEPPKSEERAA
jgi:hypothetical protein